MGRKSNERKCRVCGCTDNHACPNGCEWSDIDETLCTVCEDAVEALAAWFLDARRPAVGKLIKEFRRQVRIVVDEMNGAAARTAEATTCKETL